MKVRGGSVGRSAEPPASRPSVAAEAGASAGAVECAAGSAGSFGAGSLGETAASEAGADSARLPRPREEERVERVVEREEERVFDCVGCRGSRDARASDGCRGRHAGNS